MNENTIRGFAERIVDTIRYRFYDRLDLYDVYRWLDNFQDDEQEMAVSVLEKLEYYREEDLLGMLLSKLNTIFNDLWGEIQNHFVFCLCHWVNLGKVDMSLCIW